jgi:hypothetical protein
MEYVARLARDRSAEALDEWSSVRQRLFEAIRESGDEVAIEAAESADELTAAIPGA